MTRPHPRWTTDDDATAAAYAGDYLDLLEPGDDEIADIAADRDLPGRWVA